MKLQSGFLILFFIENVFCFYKRWLPNTNFDTHLNWNTGKVPCGNDQVIIPDDSPTIMLNSSSTIGQLVLPSNGILVLGMNNILSFTSSSDDPNCINSGEKVEFNATYAREWVDPANWCLVNSIDGPCVNNVALLDSEKIPCTSDDVIFTPGNSYFIDFGTDMELTINSMRFLGKTYSTNSFENFMTSEKGKHYFKSYHSDESPAYLNIRRRPCRDPASCDCGNYKPPIFRKICEMHSPFCKRPQCKQPVRPTGHCCNICGAVIKSKFENGFNYETFVNNIKQEFLHNETGIELVVSRIDTSIQLTLTDPAGDTSGVVALKIFQDIKDDIKRGSHKYIFSEVEIKISGATKSKISTSPPPPPPLLPTTTTKTGTSVVTTSKVVKEPITKDHLKSVNSSSSSSSRSSSTASGLTDIGIMEIILGGLALQVLIILVFILYRRGKISSFVDHVRRNQIVVNLHKRFVNQDSVPMEDLPNATLDNDGGFQNPMYGTRTRQSGKLDYLTNDSEIGESSNGRRGFDNPLFGSDMNQGTLLDAASKIPPLTMNPVYDPNELQDSTI